MKLLHTINQNPAEPEDYEIRKTVRLVIVDESGENILFFGTHFPGGGVEEGETDEEAVVREAMEEVGARVEIVEPIGEVIAYRDFLKKKYVVHGYFCKQIGDFEKPTTTDENEMTEKSEWIPLSKAVQKFEELIELDSQGMTFPITDDLIQSRLHNRGASLVILEEFIRMKNG